MSSWLRVFTSLRLTVVLLAFGLILVFWGTLAQVNLGLYRAQNEFFRSFFIYWSLDGSGLRIPIFPGGYLVGGLLLINLFAAHLRYYQPGRKKYGIVLIHVGVVLLLLGQLFTDLLSTESLMHLRLGDTRNYSESSRQFELAVIDSTDARTDHVVAISGKRLRKKGEIKLPEMPFTLRIVAYHDNSSLTNAPATGYEEVKTARGIGSAIWWRPLPRETEMDRRDMPSAIIELIGPQGSLGSCLVSAYLSSPQVFTHNDRVYQLTMRLERFYKPYSVHLLEFRHDKYPGTEIPKNFSSRVRVAHSRTGEEREVLIYMNNPLRYEGETYYQASFDTDNQGTVLQVVRNPSWLTPYFSCVLVGIGMLIQFCSHLIGFASKRRAA